MYRTYRELYRAKTELTKIGSGVGAFKLGKYVAVGLDVIGLGAIAAIFPGIFIATILHLLYRPVAPWVWQIVIGILVVYIARQFDPQGKSVLRWTIDLVRYFTRKHLTEGFNKKGIKINSKAPSYRYAFYAVDGGIVRSTPIYGKGAFTLHRPLGFKLKRDGTWLLSRSHHPLEPGKYRVMDGEIKRVREAPKLRRNDHDSLSC